MGVLLQGTKNTLKGGSVEKEHVEHVAVMLRNAPMIQGDSSQNFQLHLVRD